MQNKNKYERMNISLYDKDKQRLEELAKRFELSRSAIIRLAIKKLYDETTKKERI